MRFVLVFMRLVNLERSCMAIPTKDFTIGEGIATCATSMMCLPFAPPFSTSVLPHELFVASHVGMVVRTSTALTLSACSSPRSLNSTFWKSHCFTPLLLISFPCFPTSTWSFIILQLGNLWLPIHSPTILCNGCSIISPLFRLNLR